MTETPIGIGVLNRPAARFVAIGLFLMAFFTALWASWSFYGLSAFLGVALIVIFGAFAVIFVINGVQLFRSAAQLPLPAGAESQRRGRALRVGFGVTFASEGVVIAVVCALLAINGGYAYFAPAIALVVGLHFIPSAFSFVAASISTSRHGWWSGPLSVSGLLLRRSWRRHWWHRSSVSPPPAGQPRTASTCCGSNERSWQRWTNRFTQLARQANSGRLAGAYGVQWRALG